MFKSIFSSANTMQVINRTIRLYSSLLRPVNSRERNHARDFIKHSGAFSPPKEVLATFYSSISLERGEWILWKLFLSHRSLFEKTLLSLLKLKSKTKPWWASSTADLVPLPSLKEPGNGVWALTCNKPELYFWKRPRGKSLFTILYVTYICGKEIKPSSGTPHLDLVKSWNYPNGDTHAGKKWQEPLHTLRRGC